MTFDLEMLDVLAWVTLTLGLLRPLKKELKTHHPKFLVYVTRQVLPVYIYIWHCRCSFEIICIIYQIIK